MLSVPVVEVAYTVWRDVIDLDQPGEAVDQHTGFAATGAGQYQHMSVFRCYRIPLRFIQFVQQMRNVHPTRLVLLLLLCSQCHRA